MPIAIHRWLTPCLLVTGWALLAACGAGNATSATDQLTGGVPNTTSSANTLAATAGGTTNRLGSAGGTTLTSSAAGGSVQSVQSGGAGVTGGVSTAGGLSSTGGSRTSGGTPPGGGSDANGGLSTNGGAEPVGGATVNATGYTTGGATPTGGNTSRSTLASSQVMTTCETPAVAVQSQRIEAECAFGAGMGNCKGSPGGQQGTQLENGDTDVGYIEEGDFLYYGGVALTGITTLRIRYSKGVDGGSMEIRLDGTTGQLLGTITPEVTGSWTTWSESSTTLSTTTGTHALYFVFKGSSAGILSLDWFEVSAGPPSDAPAFHVNQVGFDTQGAKHAVIEGPSSLTRFQVVDEDGSPVWCGDLSAQSFDAWGSSHSFYSVDFTGLTRPGNFRLQVGDSVSPPFTVADKHLLKSTLGGVLDYFTTARADDPDVWATDEHVPINGGGEVADVRGGWYDASGDISKYLSHLSYANFMNPQQIPLVAWALAWAYDEAGTELAELGKASAMKAEALWGADYLLRVLDPAGYFYITVFDNWSGNLEQRQVCAFTGQGGSVTSDYQSALREGGGMSIAALARIAKWETGASFTSEQYIEGAKRAFALLDTNGVQFADDGKENIIDDYTGLLAACELFAATGEAGYLDAARARAASLVSRLGPAGYFIADGDSRPFWHASDAGLPVVALTRYVQLETDETRKGIARSAIRAHLDYLLRVTSEVPNPYGYARQPISASGTGFFIPHENETGYWWQGENARLGSLAAAALLGADALGASGEQSLELLRFAGTQLDWILGANPYDLCFLQGYGTQNPPDFCSTKAQWASLVGGIANGITGREADGSGIQWTSGSGCWDDWRWVEQWLPHAAWYLVAITALAR